jgi:hypothetical protein
LTLMFLVIYKANAFVSVLYPNWPLHHLYNYGNHFLALENRNVTRNEIIDILLLFL